MYDPDRMPDRRWATIAAVVGVVVGLAAPARAQAPTDGFGIERFHLGVDRAALLDVDPADVPEHASWSTGMWIGFAHDPLVVYDREMNAAYALVRRRVTTGLVGSYALWRRLELGIRAEVVADQAGIADGSTPRTLPTTGLGDLALVARVVLVRGDSYAVAVAPTVSVPLGSATGYLREAGPTFAPELSVSGTVGPVRGAANAG